MIRHFTFRSDNMSVFLLYIKINAEYDKILDKWTGLGYFQMYVIPDK